MTMQTDDRNPDQRGLAALVMLLRFDASCRVRDFADRQSSF
jgi:hypothetical protein